VKPGFVPDKGEIVWLDFDPQAGHEQAKRRPALVLSPKIYNKHGLMICCPITSKVKGYPFEVAVDGGVVLADQVKSLDWKIRHAKPKDKAPAAAVQDVLAKVAALLGL
jgi:mRNA interferase MazF